MRRQHFEESNRRLNARDPYPAMPSNSDAPALDHSVSTSNRSCRECDDLVLAEETASARDFAR